MSTNPPRHISKPSPVDRLAAKTTLDPLERGCRKSLGRLAAIADAYDADGLDEARPERGEGLDKDRRVVLVSGRGGRELLTLGDCLDARELLRSHL